MASAFFGKGQFVAQSMTRKQRHFELTQTLEGPYYQPLPPEHLPDDGDWEKMPRELRPVSEVQRLVSMVC